MKQTDRFTRRLLALLLASVCALAPLVLAGCADEDDDDEPASLSLSNDSLMLTTALEGRTSATLTATLTGYDAGLEWYSSNKGVVTVAASGSAATITCGGTAGTAKVGVRTTDGALEAYCIVVVELSHTPALPPTDVAVAEDSITQNGFTVIWKKSTIASKVVIDVFESEDARTAANGLAAASSDTEPAAYKSYTAPNTAETYTVSDLLTDATGKTYYISVYGYINGKRSTRYENRDVMLQKDTVAPESVTAVDADSADHAITVHWTEPADADYDHVTVTISPATDFAGAALAADVATQTLAKGTTSATFERLVAGTEYTFTFKTGDYNGNEQGDANNAEAIGITAAFTTAADTTEPEAVTEAAATFTVNGNVSVTWTQPADADFKQVVIAPATTTDGVTAPEAQTVAAGIQTATFTCDTAAEYTFAIVAYDYDGNPSAVVTVSAAKPVVTDVAAAKTTAYSGVVIAWTEPALASGYTYTYTVAAYDGDTQKAAQTVNSGTASCQFSTELDFETEYTYTVTTTVTETDTPANTASYVSASTAMSAMSKVTWTIWSVGTGGWVLPTATNVIVVSGETTDTTPITKDSYSTTFICRPPFATAEAYTDKTGEPVSLEATNADENPTGYYLYFPGTSASATAALGQSADINTDDLKQYASFYTASWANNSTQTVPSGSTITMIRLIPNYMQLMTKGASQAIGLESNNGKRGVTTYVWAVNTVTE